MLGAFFDDSGTHQGSDVVAMGGLLGTEPQWDVFEKKWNRTLQESIEGQPPLKYFHLTACRNGTDEFARYSPAERDRINCLFRQVILESGLYTVAVAVERQAWDELMVGAIAQHSESALGFCFFKCVETVADIIRKRRPGEPIVMFFDAGTEQRLDELAQGFRRARPFMWPEIVSLSFAPVKKVIALQGADMMAYETYVYAVESLHNPENPNVHPHFKDFFSRELTVGLFARRPHIEEIAARIRKTIAANAPKEVPAGAGPA
jgi:hypothetical protein